MALAMWAISPAWGQTPAREKKIVVSGEIKDVETGETLSGVTVRAGSTGAVSNAYGFYSLSHPPADTLTLVFTLLGYKTITEKIVGLKENQTLNVKMGVESVEMEAVVIEGERIQDLVESTQMSRTKLDIVQMQKIPAIFGEVDVVKVLQFLPGIKAGTEGTAGFYVRGGGSDQNLILLDEAVVYNASHLGGLFSVFNSDAVKELEVYKADFPARYGGRLSSVLDVKMKEGNNQKYHAAGGLGLISSRLAVEGPIVRDKGSFMVAGRRTYIDLFTSLINKINEGANSDPLPNYRFWDINLKANYNVTPKDRIFVSAFLGRDVLGFKNDVFDFQFYWQNATVTTRWNRIINNRMFMNASAIFCSYNYEITNRFSDARASFFSKILNGSGKADFEWTAAPTHKLRFGGQYIYHHFNPNGLNATVSGSDQDIPFSFNDTKTGHEGAAYISDEWDATKWLRINAGVRFSGFAALNRTYGGVEPRAAARFRVHPDVSLKASFARTYQYIHLVSNAASALPTDIWYPSTDRIRPQFADQVAAGATWVFPKIDFAITVEGYYKWLNNQLMLIPGSNIFLNSELDKAFVVGDGWSYGAEIYLEKRAGKFSGWISYTLAWAWRRFPDIQAEAFPFRFDRRHDLSVVVNYDFHNKEKRNFLTLSAIFVYRTGEAVTIADQYAFFPGTANFAAINLFGTPVGLFEKFGNFRMPAYHRVDLSATYKFKPMYINPNRNLHIDLNFTAYNLYNRANPFFFFYDQARGQGGGFVGFQGKIVALFPIIPTFTLNFKF